MGPRGTAPSPSGKLSWASNRRSPMRPAAYVRSKPAQNAPPAPHRTAIHCDGLASKASSASVSASALAGSIALPASCRSRMSVLTGRWRSVLKVAAVCYWTGRRIGRAPNRPTSARFAICGISATAERVGAIAHQAMRRDDAERLVLLGVGEALVALQPAQRVDLGVSREPFHERRARLIDAPQLDDALGRHAGEAARRRRLEHQLTLKRRDRGAPARVEADRNRQPMAAGVAGCARDEARSNKGGALPGTFACGRYGHWRCITVSSTFIASLHCEPSLRAKLSNPGTCFVAHAPRNDAYA